MHVADDRAGHRFRVAGVRIVIRDRHQQVDARAGHHIAGHADDVVDPTDIARMPCGMIGDSPAPASFERDVARRHRLVLGDGFDDASVDHII